MDNGKDEMIVMLEKEAVLLIVMVININLAKVCAGAGAGAGAKAGRAAGRPGRAKVRRSRRRFEVRDQFQVSLKRENGTCVSYRRGRITVPTTVTVCLEVRFS